MFQRQRVPGFVTDMTSAEEISKLKVSDTVFYTREKGSGTAHEEGEKNA